MAPDAHTEEIEIRLVLEAIYSKYGYDFRDYAVDSMRRRVQAALARSGIHHLGELQHRLLVEPDLFASMLGDLTVQVSEMFRDPPFYKMFREQVVPKLRTYPQLKIWHAGCATGEEAYATAILLMEENLYDRAQIYATDMSPRALEQAREGVYSEAQSATFAANYREAGGKHIFEDYCSAAYGRVAMREVVRKNVLFFEHDLVSDYAVGEMNVVFCRNVLIYFGQPLRERVLSMFAASICRGGFLCLGGSEHLPASAVPLFSEFAPASRIYRRRSDS